MPTETIERDKWLAEYKLRLADDLAKAKAEFAKYEDVGKWIIVHPQANIYIGAFETEGEAEDYRRKHYAETGYSVAYMMWFRQKADANAD